VVKLVEVSVWLRQAVGYIGTGVDIRLYPRKEFERWMVLLVDFRRFRRGERRPCAVRGAQSRSPGLCFA